MTLGFSKVFHSISWKNVTILIIIIGKLQKVTDDFHVVENEKQTADFIPGTSRTSSSLLIIIIISS